MRRMVQQLGGVPEGSGRIFGPSARIMITGGAPPDPDIMLAFERSGVHVVEAYGASEFSLVALTRPGQWRPGVVGHVLDDVTLRITEDGELHAWTPVLMRGYHEAPELTRAAFTEDGFYRTGDRVEITEGGELRYLGRVVDSFNLFDGSHVAPGPIEEAMAKLPWIEQVMLLGDQRPYLTGLVVPHAALRGEVAPALRRLIERDLGRICAEWAPNARVRRVAVLRSAPCRRPTRHGASSMSLSYVFMTKTRAVFSSMSARVFATVTPPGNRRPFVSRCRARSWTAVSTCRDLRRA
jgi:acyl-CoA synthetase (AMP-forming)/AMP-acid ligase II